MHTDCQGTVLKVGDSCTDPVGIELTIESFAPKGGAMVKSADSYYWIATNDLMKVDLGGKYLTIHNEGHEFYNEITADADEADRRGSVIVGRLKSVMPQGTWTYRTSKEGI
jgi:hypothetical protein